MTGPLADHALEALRIYGCGYTRKPLSNAYSDAWRADCPACGEHRTLTITEPQRGKRVSIGCATRCAPPDQLAAMLASDLNELELRVQRDRALSLADEARQLAAHALTLARQAHTPDTVLRAAA